MRMIAVRRIVFGGGVFRQIIEGRSHIEQFSIQSLKADVDGHGARMPARAGGREQAWFLQPVRIFPHAVCVHHFCLRVRGPQAVIEDEAGIEILRAVERRVADDMREVFLKKEFGVKSINSLPEKEVVIPRIGQIDAEAEMCREGVHADEVCRGDYSWAGHCEFMSDLLSSV